MWTIVSDRSVCPDADNSQRLIHRASVSQSHNNFIKLPSILEEAVVLSPWPELRAVDHLLRVGVAVPPLVVVSSVPGVMLGAMAMAAKAHCDVRCASEA